MNTPHFSYLCLDKIYFGLCCFQNGWLVAIFIQNVTCLYSYFTNYLDCLFKISTWIHSHIIWVKIWVMLLSKWQIVGHICCKKIQNLSAIQLSSFEITDWKLKKKVHGHMTFEKQDFGYQNGQMVAIFVQIKLVYTPTLLII